MTRAIALARLTVALDRTEDEIERLWELPFATARDEWDRLRARALAIERTIRRVER